MPVTVAALIVSMVAMGSVVLSKINSDFTNDSGKEAIASSKPSSGIETGPKAGNLSSENRLDESQGEVTEQDSDQARVNSANKDQTIGIGRNDIKNALTRFETIQGAKLDTDFVIRNTASYLVTKNFHERFGPELPMVRLVNEKTLRNIGVIEVGKELTLKLQFFAGNDQKVIAGMWNGITCSLVEVNSEGVINEYSGSAPSAVGKSHGVAEISLDVSGVTPTSELPQGHYYELRAAFRSSVDESKDIVFEQPFTHLNVVRSND